MHMNKLMMMMKMMFLLKGS